MRHGLDALEERSKSFTVETIRLCTVLEVLPGLRRVTWQLIDAAGSVGANHRAMRRARSDREFVAKLQIVNEEIDESVSWLEVCADLYPSGTERLPKLLQEGRELRSIFAKARATTRQRLLTRSLVPLAVILIILTWWRM